MIKLKVDYKDKDYVKALGARWNQNEKFWYIPDTITDIEPFTPYIENYEDYYTPNPTEGTIQIKDLGINKEYKYTLPELKENDFVILDTETTGLTKDDEVIELGIVDSKGTVLYDSLFKPKKDIPYVITKINGISNDMVKDSPTMNQEWDRIKKLIGDRTVIAYNTPFDYRVMKQTIKKHGGNPDEVDTLFTNYKDAMSMYCRYEQLGVCRYKLEKAAEDYGIHIIQTHRASDDCLLTLKVLQMLDSKKKDVCGTPKKVSDLKSLLITKMQSGIFCLSDLAKAIGTSERAIEDCLYNEFSKDELKGIPGFMFERYYASYEYLRITGYLIKNKWDGYLHSIKKHFPEISYTAIKFILKKFLD